MTSISNVNPVSPEQTLPHIKPISQSALKHLVRDLNIWKMQAELLGSQQSGKNLLQKGIKISYRKGNLVYCNGVDKLLQELECRHDPKECSDFFFF